MPKRGSIKISIVVLAGILLAGCSGSYAIDSNGATIDADPVVIGPAPHPRHPGGHGPNHGKARIPAGHYPPPGSCRVWYPDRPPGHQPPPTSCNVRVPSGAFLVRG